MQGQSVINNKRIMKNTVLLYIRMFFSMVVSLYTVRVVLQQLGVMDYGIYNVVGAVVSLFSFISGSLSTASNRFFAREMVRGDAVSFRNCFNLNLLVFISILLAAILLLETVGLWYVNTKMVIPPDRLSAANIVYQLSILSLVFSVITISYSSLIIVHEYMSFYAYMGIGEALIKLGIALALTFVSGDKLVAYGVLMLVSIAIIMFLNMAYCLRNFPESRWHWYWNKAEFKTLVSFVGWNFFGTISAAMKSGGVNLLINYFFNPVVNAARAVSFQVEGFIQKFADGYFTAAKPQLYKAYANGEVDGLNKLITRIAIMMVALSSLFAFPVAFNAEYILQLWLGQVPDKTAIFLQLVLIEGIINLSSNPVILTILATGKIRSYQLLEFTQRSLVLIFSWVALHQGEPVESVFVICILISLLAVFMRVWCLKRTYPPFQAKEYMILMVKMAIVSFFIILINHFFSPVLGLGLLKLLVSSALSMVAVVLLYLCFVLSPADRIFVVNKSIAYVHRKFS